MEMRPVETTRKSTRRFWWESKQARQNGVQKKNSITSELLEEILCAKFTQVLCLLSQESALTVEQFKRIRDITQSTYWVDTQKCFSKSGRPIASGIFNIFGKFDRA